MLRKKRRNTQPQNNCKRRKKEKEFNSSYELEKPSSPTSITLIPDNKSQQSDTTKSLPEDHLLNFSKDDDRFSIHSTLNLEEIGLILKIKL